MHISNFSAFCDSITSKEYLFLNCLNRMRNVKEKQNYFNRWMHLTKKNVTNHVLKWFQFLQRNNFVSKGDWRIIEPWCKRYRYCFNKSISCKGPLPGSGRPWSWGRVNKRWEDGRSAGKLLVLETQSKRNYNKLRLREITVLKRESSL